MSDFSCRSFLFASSGAAAGSLLVPGLAEADEGDPQFTQSGLVTGNPKPLIHASIPGFQSAEQIAPHHTAHYGGALKGYAAADAAIEKSIKDGEPIDEPAYGALKRAISSKGTASSCTKCTLMG